MVGLCWSLLSLCRQCCKRRVEFVGEATGVEEKLLTLKRRLLVLVEQGDVTRVGAAATGFREIWSFN